MQEKYDSTVLIKQAYCSAQKIQADFLTIQVKKWQ